MGRPLDMDTGLTNSTNHAIMGIAKPDVASPPVMELLDEYFHLRVRELQTELNWIRKQLGYNPKRCPNCGYEHR